MNNVSCIPSGALTRALRPPQGGVTGAATRSAPPATSRSAVASLSATSSAKRTVPDTRRPGFDLVDGRSLRLVEQLQRRPPGIEQDHAATVRAPVGDLSEPERIAVEREGLVEVGHGQRHSQLGYLGHTRSNAP